MDNEHDSAQPLPRPSEEFLDRMQANLGQARQHLDEGNLSEAAHCLTDVLTDMLRDCVVSHRTWPMRVAQMSAYGAALGIGAGAAWAGDRLRRRMGIPRTVTDRDVVSIGGWNGLLAFRQDGSPHVVTNPFMTWRYNVPVFQDLLTRLSNLLEIHRAPVVPGFDPDQSIPPAPPTAPKRSRKGTGSKVPKTHYSLNKERATSGKAKASSGVRRKA